MGISTDLDRVKGLRPQLRLSVVWVLLVGLTLAIGGAGWRWMGSRGADRKTHKTYTVSRGDLPIVFTERGSLQAQVETTIVNRVQTIHDRGGHDGTQIIFIVPDGSVAKGPPPPIWSVKLVDKSLLFFAEPNSAVSVDDEAGADPVTERSPDFSLPLVTDVDATFSEERELIQSNIVRAFADKRLDRDLHQVLLERDPEFPKTVHLETVQLGKEWTISLPGDLLIEMNSAAVRDRIEEQEIRFNESAANKIKQDLRYENRVLKNATAVAKAALEVKLTELEHKKFSDPVKGDYQLSLEQVERQIDDQNNMILKAQTTLELQGNEQRAYLELFKRGYKGKGDLDRVRSAFLGAETGLVASMNRLETLQAGLQSLEEYDRRMQELTLKGAMDTAKRRQQQVKNDNAAELQQAEASRYEATQWFKHEKNRLERRRNQLDYCYIYAPHDGMVVYAREREGRVEVQEGRTVHERQRLVTLPDLSRMQVKTQIHEAMLNQVHVGLPVTVRLDAVSEKTFRGTIDSIAVVSRPGWWGNTAVKIYDTVVLLEEVVEGLKPGMTAVCDIHVDGVKDSLLIPVPAVFQIGRDSWCCVDGENGLDQRRLELGQSNDKFVEIVAGLEVGERVLVDPMAALETLPGYENTISPDGGVPAIKANDTTDVDKKANLSQQSLTVGTENAN